MDKIFLLRYEESMEESAISKFEFFRKQNGLPKNDFFWSKMTEYFALVGLWGEKINFTSNRGLDQFLYENIADPLCAYFAFNKSEFIKSEQKKPLKLVDLGCGGGFVGMIWHIASEGRFKTLLVDSDRRKINFCKQVIRELRLENVSALQIRAEEIQVQKENPPYIIISRATWSFEKFVQISKKYCSTGTKIIYFSGKKNMNADIENKITVIDYEIPERSIQRQLWCHPKFYG